MKRLQLAIISLSLSLLTASAQSAEPFPFQLLKAGYGDEGELLIIGRFNRPLAKRIIPQPDFFGDIQLTAKPELKTNSKDHFLLIIRQFSYAEAYLNKQPRLPQEGAFNTLLMAEIKVGLITPCPWTISGCRTSNVIPVKSCPSSAWVGSPPPQEAQLLKELKTCRIDTHNWD